MDAWHLRVLAIVKLPGTSSCLKNKSLVDCIAQELTVFLHYLLFLQMLPLHETLSPSTPVKTGVNGLNPWPISRNWHELDRCRFHATYAPHGDEDLVKVRA